MPTKLSNFMSMKRMILCACCLAVAGCDVHFHQTLNDDGSRRCGPGSLVEHETWGINENHVDPVLEGTAVGVFFDHTHPGLDRAGNFNQASSRCRGDEQSVIYNATISDDTALDSGGGLAANAVPATLIGVAAAATVIGGSSSTTGTQ